MFKTVWNILLAFVMIAQGVGPSAMPIRSAFLPASEQSVAEFSPFLQEVSETPPAGYSVTETATLEPTITETPTPTESFVTETATPTEYSVTPTGYSVTDTPIPSETPTPQTPVPTGSFVTETPTETPTLTETPTPTETATATPATSIDITVDGDEADVEIPGNGANVSAFEKKLKIYFTKNALPEALKVHLKKLKRDEVPASLGGSPFEISAEGRRSRRVVRKFNKAIKIELSYNPEDFPGEEDNLRLFYYDEEEQAWMVLPGYADTKKHVIVGYSDHLTVFDFDIDSWDPTFLPSVKNSDVSGYTGSSSFSLPIELPPLPGGNPFTLNLTYNSQSVDELSNTTQASMVGAGWSLDTGYIRRDLHGSSDIREDDSLSLFLNGQSYSLWPDVNDTTIYHTGDESHLLIKRTAGSPGSYFHVIDPAGNRYNFEESSSQSTRPVYNHPGPTENCSYVDSNYTWRWSMNKIVTPANQTLTFQYGNPQKNTLMCNTSTPKMNYENYPTSIDYSNGSSAGRYRVVFEYADRSDYKKTWKSSNSRAIYYDKKLVAINIWHDANGDGTVDEIIKRYELYYAGDPLPEDPSGDSRHQHVYPGFTYDAGDSALTLIKVRQIGRDGLALPSTDFYYEDGAHLTKVTNGYGATTLFTYEPWNETTTSTGRTWSDYIKGDGGTCSEEDGAENIYGEWKADTDENGNLDCITFQGVRNLAIDNGAYISLEGGMVRPNALYKVAADVGWGRAGLSFDIRTNQGITDRDRITIDSNTLHAYIRMPAYASGTAAIRFICDECGINSATIRVLPTYYRVTEKRIIDGTTSGETVYRYNYDEPATNTTANTTFGSKPYTPKYAEFRGNAVGEVEVWKDNGIENVNQQNSVSTTTWYYQNDEYRGKPGVTLLRSENTLDGVSQQPVHDSFETGLNPLMWSLGSLWIMSDRYGGDQALQLQSMGAMGVTQISRTGIIANGEAALFSFQAQDDEQGTFLLRDANNNGNSYGICVNSFDGATAILTALNGSCGSTLISPNPVDYDKWYSALIIADDTHPLIWVWEQDDPTVQGFQVLAGITPAAGWVFQATTNGILRLDDYSEGRVYSMTRYEYGNEKTTPKVPTDAAGANYTGISVIWSYLKNESTYTFDGAKFTGLRKDYRYLPDDQINASNQASQYGNLTRVVESHSSGTEVYANGFIRTKWNAYRMTRTQYRPNNNGDTKYLVGLPVRQSMYDCATDPNIDICSTSLDTPLAETFYLYDNYNSYDHAPISPKLTGKRQWVYSVGNTRYYADEQYYYDRWGNRSSVYLYTRYSTASGTPVGSVLSRETCYGGFDGSSCTSADSDYGIYPVAEINAAGQVTQWGYDYGLGVPVMEMDPNGATTLAWYDGLGRMTRLVRPGDDYANPTVKITYPDGYFAGGGPELTDYEVDIRQKLDDETQSQVRKIYSSTGVSLQTQVLEAVLEDGACEGMPNGERDVCSLISDTHYDAQGQVVKASIPYAIADQPEGFYDGPGLGYDANNPGTVTQFDAAGRVIAVIQPDQSLSTNAYSLVESEGKIFYQATAWDALGRPTTQSSDARGRLTKVQTVEGLFTDYSYDKMDRLETATTGGVTTTITYDKGGRKTKLTDPDMGEWTYTYDGIGNLLTQEDARHCKIILSYDTLNRVTGKTYTGSGECASTPQVTYGYDAGVYGIGRRTSMTDGTGATQWQYDERGRVVREARQITDTGTYVTGWEYNSADLPVTFIYPGGREGQPGERLRYSYLPQMTLDTAASDEQTYLQATGYTASQQVSSRLIGQLPTDPNLPLFSEVFSYYSRSIRDGSRNVQDDEEYSQYAQNQASIDGEQSGNSLGRLKQATVTRQSDATRLQNLFYEYDRVGNIMAIQQDTYAGSEPVPQIRRYSYDGLDRILSGVVTGGDGTGLPNESFAYDPVTGNLVTKNGIDYEYDSAHPHAVGLLKQGNNPPITINSYQYDNNGNQITRQIGAETYTLSYDAENRLVHATGPSDLEVFFVYDGDGKLVHKYQGDSHTAYIGNYLEVDHSTQLYPPTPTPSMTPTVTKTATATPKPTKTSIGGQENPTSANSATPSRTYTRTVTRTATATQTRTKTPAATKTKTQTPVLATATKTATKKPFVTGTLAKTYTPTTTRTGTQTPPTSTRTPVNTPTAVPTRTPVTPTATPTSVVTSVETWRFYYYAGSARIAVREKTSSSNQLFFLLADHLGGTSKTVNASGQVVAELRYTAFGETWYGNGSGDPKTPTGLRYTGQREYEGLKLYFYQSRFYDPYTTQFSQPDTVAPEFYNPLDWGRYSYVRYNPINSNDPTGHRACDDEQNGQCYTDPTGRWQLPTVEQVPNPENRPILKTINRYSRLRDALYSVYGNKAVTPGGKIKDKFFILSIINGEFGDTKTMPGGQNSYYESLEAVSNQYADKFEETGSKNNMFCDNSCSLIEQIAWAGDVQGIYSGHSEDRLNKNKDLFDSFLADATKAMNGFVYGNKNSWMWGNANDEDIVYVNGVPTYNGNTITSFGPSLYPGYKYSITWGWPMR